jgi:hypothetical protein
MESNALDSDMLALWSEMGDIDLQQHSPNSLMFLEDDEIPQPKSSNTDQKVQRRLARKAELARESRRRKKLYLSELEDKLDRLQTRITELENRSRAHQHQEGFQGDEEEEGFNVEDSINKIKSQLTPILPVKFLMWILDQKDVFYEGNGLWRALFSGELRCSPEVLSELCVYRSTMGTERVVLNGLEDELDVVCGQFLELIKQSP